MPALTSMALIFLFGTFRISQGQTATPTIEIQAVVSRDKIERQEQTIVYIGLANKSATPITISRIGLTKASFDVTTPSVPISLAPFEGRETDLTFKPGSTTKYGVHKLLLSVEFTWAEGGKQFTSTQTTPITVEVTRQFEEEAKGFPGGTAAFFYLLLPIIPGILSYQLFERLRTGKGLLMPTFEAEYIVPAFFAAIVLSFIMLSLAHSERVIDYSNPWVFITVLTASLVVGASVPAGRWIAIGIARRRWAFSRADSMVEYLEKALLGPQAPDQFKWVKATANGETWEGLLLEQPNTAKVLGACLQASPSETDDAAYQAALADIERSVLDKTGTIKDAKKLVDLARAGDVTLSYRGRIKQGEKVVKALVIIDGLENSEISEPVVKPLITLVN